MQQNAPHMMGDAPQKDRREWDIRSILEMLPHRYPFLLVDRVVDFFPEQDRIICQKNVTVNEQFFQGHFPQQPIMPGVLVIEALAQAGGILMYLRGFQKIKLLTGVSEAKFRKPIFPGDILKLDVKALFMSHRGGRLQAVAWNGDQKAVEAEITFSSLNF